MLELELVISTIYEWETSVKAVASFVEDQSCEPFLDPVTTRKEKEKVVVSLLVSHISMINLNMCVYIVSSLITIAL